MQGTSRRTSGLTTERHFHDTHNEKESSSWSVGICPFEVSKIVRPNAQKVSVFASDTMRATEKNLHCQNPYPICPALAEEKVLHIISDPNLQKEFLKFHRYGPKPESLKDIFFQKVQQFSSLVGWQTQDSSVENKCPRHDLFKDGFVRDRVLKVFPKPNFLTLYEGENKEIRSAVISFFTQDYLRNFSQICSDICESWVKQVAEQGTIQLFQSVSELVSRFLIEGILGYTCYNSEEMSLQTHLWKEFFFPVPSALHHAHEESDQAIPEKLSDFFLDLSAFSSKAEAYFFELEKLHELTARIVKFGCSEEGRQRMNLPNFLYEKGIEPELLEGTIGMMLLAGQETTSYLLAFILYECAANPLLVQQERQMNPDYLKSIFLEGLRKYPTGGATREAGIDIEVTNEQNQEKYYIQKEELITCVPYVAGHNSTEWPNPEEFNPGRENLSQVKQKTLAFGHGAHRCVGEKAAEVEITTALSVIFTHLELFTDEKLPELIDAVVLKPLHDVNVNVKLKAL